MSSTMKLVFRILAIMWMALWVADAVISDSAYSRLQSFYHEYTNPALQHQKNSRYSNKQLVAKRGLEENADNINIQDNIGNTGLTDNKDNTESHQKDREKNRYQGRGGFRYRNRNRNRNFGKDPRKSSHLSRLKGIRRPVFSLNNNVITHKIWGLTYSPYRADGSCPDYSTLAKEVISISQLANNIRIYSTDCSQLENILRAISENRLPLGIYAGIWVSEGEQRAGKETEEFIKIATQYMSSGIIKGLSVGNEELFKKSMSEDSLIELIQKTKSRVKADYLSYMPVYTTEVDNLFSRKLAAVCDLVQANIYSAFDQNFSSISHSVDSVFNRILELQRRVGRGKLVRVGETGYPSGGNFANQPYSVENMASYASRFCCRAKSMGLEYFYFEAKDSIWKKTSAELERNFGLYRSDFTSKFPLVKINSC